MTITDQRPAIDPELIARGRKLVVNGRLPGKRELQKELRVGWDRVNEVLSVLAEEIERDALRLRLRARRGAAKRRAQGPRRRRINVCFSGVNAPAQKPQAVAPVEPVPVGMPEAVQKHPEPARRPVVTWPALLVAAPAFVAIWAGWVAIGKMTGFGPVNLLPGFGSGFTVDTAITLPIGVEAYAGYAFYVALHRAAPLRARQFAGWSAALAVLLGMGGQTAYHLMSAAGMQLAPWQITTVVSCLPVAVFGVTAALIHMVRAGEN